MPNFKFLVLIFFLIEEKSVRRMVENREELCMYASRKQFAIELASFSFPDGFFFCTWKNNEIQ